MQPVPEMRFARTSDGVTIAHQVVGRGPALVWLPSALSHVQSQWRIPAMRAAYETLARHLTVVLYDGRGMGGSDRRIDLDDLGIDAHLRDLEAVLDAAGLERVSLLGYYQSVATALAFAARRPERVERLVLFGGAARLAEAVSPAQTQALLSLVEQDWDLFADAAATTWLGWETGETARLTAEAFRTSTTASIAQAWFAAIRDTDVTPELPKVLAPALVLHRQAERQIPVEVAQRLAGALPHGALVSLPGSTPTLFIEDLPADARLVTGFVCDGEVVIPWAGPGGSSSTPAALPDLLTPREAEVLRSLAGGGSNADIARQLGIAVHTVERHLSNLYRKIGARGRTDAAAYALRRGLDCSAGSGD